MALLSTPSRVTARFATSTPGAPPAGGGDDSSCGCKAPMALDLSVLNDCNVLYGDPSNIASNVASNMCDAMQCAAGIGRGLVKIPFQVTLAPAGTIAVSIQFARDAYVWGIVFFQGRPDFDRQQWTISNLNSSAQTQAWDVYAQGSTFGVGGAQPFNPNTAALPLELFFEQGDDDLSNLIHHRNFLPPLVTNSNVGDGNNAINYTLTLSALAAGAQVATGWHYVYFPGKKKAA